MTKLRFAMLGLVIAAAGVVLASDAGFAAKKGASGPRNSYSCSGLMCTCQGDADCNDMFSSGKCGDVASCESTTGICKCLMLKKQPKKRPMSDQFNPKPRNVLQ
jgi:hypothetical protein